MTNDNYQISNKLQKPIKQFPNNFSAFEFCFLSFGNLEV
jgi:hypothetical protein